MLEEGAAADASPTVSEQASNATAPPKLTAATRPDGPPQPRAERNQGGAATSAARSRAPELEGAQGLRFIGMLHRPDDGPHEERTRVEEGNSKLNDLEHVIDTIGIRIARIILAMITSLHMSKYLKAA